MVRAILTFDGHWDARWDRAPQRMPKSASRRMHRDSAAQVNAAARASFDRLYGREIRDAEFEEIRRNLLDFFGVLRRWDQERVRAARPDLQSTDGNPTSHE